MIIVPTGKQNDGAHVIWMFWAGGEEAFRRQNHSLFKIEHHHFFGLYGFRPVEYLGTRISLFAKCQCFMDAWILTRCLCSTVGILWDNATGVYSFDKHRNLVPTSLLFAEIIVIMIVTQNYVSNSWFIQCFVREMHHIFLKYTNKKIKRAPAKHECPPHE